MKSSAGVLRARVVGKFLKDWNWNYWNKKEEIFLSSYFNDSRFEQQRMYNFICQSLLVSRVSIRLRRDISTLSMRDATQLQLIYINSNHLTISFNILYYLPYPQRVQIYLIVIPARDININYYSSKFRHQTTAKKRIKQQQHSR